MMMLDTYIKAWASRYNNKEEIRSSEDGKAQHGGATTTTISSPYDEHSWAKRGLSTIIVGLDSTIV